MDLLTDAHFWVGVAFVTFILVLGHVRVYSNVGTVVIVVAVDFIIFVIIFILIFSFILISILAGITIIIPALFLQIRR